MCLKGLEAGTIYVPCLSQEATVLTSERRGNVRRYDEFISRVFEGREKHLFQLDLAKGFKGGRNPPPPSLSVR